MGHPTFVTGVGNTMARSWGLLRGSAGSHADSKARRILHRLEFAPLDCLDRYRDQGQRNQEGNRHV
jgi:hypothetical protein